MGSWIPNCEATLINSDLELLLLLDDNIFELEVYIGLEKNNKYKILSKVIMNGENNNILTFLDIIRAISSNKLSLNLLSL